MISKLSDTYFDKMVAIRRHLHQYPELSGEEQETASYITKVLDQLGLSYQKGVSGHGIVAHLSGALPGTRCVALRADMDALPIQEQSSNPYCSLHNGVMHACGHDFHTASLLGALMILNDMRDHFGGTIKAIFQPSEERYEGGAPFMIADGVLENPKVDTIFGLHADTALRANHVGFRPGKYMASTDEIHVTIIGKGGHAAMIHEVINPIPIAARLLLKWEEEIDKMKPTDTPFVLNFGRLIADGANNIVPEKAFLSGTLRLFDETKRALILKRIEEVAIQICDQYNARCIVDIRHGYPMLVNDPDVTHKAIEIAENFLGKEQVLSLAMRTTAEDFSYYLQKVPGTFFRVGVANPEKNLIHPLHSSNFDIDEEALRTSSQMFAKLAIDFLKH